MALPTLLIIGAIITLTALSGAFLFFGGKNTPQQISLDDSLPNALNVKLGREVSFNITNEAPRHARGTTSEGDFYAVNTGYGWRVIEVSNNPVSCERLRALNFPESFIEDCATSFADAKTVTEIKTENSSGDDVTIIGTISIPNDPSQSVTISSGGGNISLQNSNLEGVSNGETVVVSGTISGNASAGTVIVKEVIDVTTDEDDEIENILNSNSDSGDDIAEDDEESGDITEPETSQPLEDTPSLFNGFDLDNSGIEIQLVP